MNFSGQDWEPVVFRKAPPKTQAEARSRGLSTSGEAKKSKPLNASMTTDGQRMAKIAREEVGSHARVSKATARAIMQARLGKKMTQKAFAQAINVKPEVVSRYESGKEIPNAQVLGKMSRILGVHLTGKRIGEAI
jgi:putative transcription factor